MNSLDSHAYSPSGALGLAPIFVPIGGLIAAIILPIGYAYANVYSPIAGYVSLLLVGLLAFLLGASISKLGYASKCRNPLFLHAAGFGIGLVALYSAWAAFAYVLMAQYDDEFIATMTDVYLAPAELWELILLINEEGWYSMFGSTFTGATLWILWGIEAVIIIAGSAAFATTTMANDVFCEPCGSWCEHAADPMRRMLPDNDDALADLQPENLAPLTRLGVAPAEAVSYVTIDTWRCSSCMNTAALQAKVCGIVVGDDGKQEESAEDLTPIWVVSRTSLDAVTGLTGP
jgi:hypothetical protein